MGERVNWKRRLQPFAETYAQMATEIERMVTEASTRELRAMTDACKKPGKTNCWWATYEVAPLVAAEVRRERYARRRRIKRPCPCRARRRRGRHSAPIA